MTQTLSEPQVDMQPVYEISDADKARQLKIANAWKAYEGELDPPLEPMDGQPDDNVLSNRCQQIVNTGVDFLFGEELGISVEEGAPKEAQDFLDGVWGIKETRIPLLQKLAMNGGMAGQTFLRIVPTVTQSYRLISVDPSTVFVQTAPQDCETVLVYCIEYCTSQKVNGHPQRVYYREEIARIDPDSDGDYGDPFADTDATWQIQHWTRIGDKGNWTAAGKPIIWPYPFPPIFSNQNLPKPNDFWGYGDLPKDLVGINESLNLVQSDINRTLKLYGNPILYATGVGEGTFDAVPGRIMGLGHPDSKVVAVTLQSDVASGLSFASNLRSDIDEQSSVPGVATGRIADIPRGNLSGIAIELLFMPLLKKTGKKRCLFGKLILDVSRALLILKGFKRDIKITLAWKNPLPHDDLQNAQAAQLKKAIGVSDQTLLEEMGYDPDEEMERNQAEDAVKLTNFSRGQGLPPLPADPSQSPAQPSTQAQEPGQFGGQP